MSSDKNIEWNKVIKKEAIGTDGLDVGEIDKIGDTYIIAQRGLLDKKRYRIPKSFAESFDGNVLKLKITESEMQSCEETEGQKFEGYSFLKSSDLSKEFDTKIPLMAENIETSKSITEDKVDIIKKPVTDTKTVEIELLQEVITIERRSITDNNTVTYSNELSNIESGSNEGRTEIFIPLKREVPVIIKKPYVKEEIIVRKRPITDTKTITADVTHENLKHDNKLNINEKE